MTKHLLAGVAAFGLLSSAAFAQTYTPVSPPPAAVAPPAAWGAGLHDYHHDHLADDGSRHHDHQGRGRERQ